MVKILAFLGVPMEEELTMIYPAIINVQSYPTVGGNWTVRFNTTGKANWTLTAVNGTTWTNPVYECYDEQRQILTRSEINHDISQDYTEKSCGYGIPERSSLVNPIMMVESEKNDSLLGFIYLKFENETLEDMDSSFTFEVMPQRSCPTI